MSRNIYPVSWVHLCNCAFCNKIFYKKKYTRSHIFKNPTCSKQCQSNLSSLQHKGKVVSNLRSTYAGKPIDRSNKYAIYRDQCAFTFDASLLKYVPGFELLVQYGMVSNSNPNGVSRDHMLSRREAYDLGISPEIIKHPANCQLIFSIDNSFKGVKSHITESELIERIKHWDNWCARQESNLDSSLIGTMSSH